MPTSESLQKPTTATERYASYHFARMYDYSPAEDRKWNRKYAWYYVDLLPPERSARVLDLGCGGGRFLSFLSSRGYSNLAGIDTDEKQLTALRSAIACDVHRGDLLEFLRSASSRYDLITCHHVIEHFSRETSNELLRLAFEALLPGGRLIVTTPNAGRPWAAWHMFADLSHDHLYTSSSLTEVMELAGFSNVVVRSEGPVPLDVVSTVRWLLWKAWQEPYLKLTFMVENGLGCLSGANLIVAGGLIATGVRLP